MTITEATTNGTRPAPTTTGVFDQYTDKVYPHRWAGSIVVTQLVGGTPATDDVAIKWLRHVIRDKEDQTRDDIMAELVKLGVDPDDPNNMINADIGEEAIAKVAKDKTLSGFKRDADGVLFIEGRQLKACLKEAVSIATNAGTVRPDKWMGAGVNKTYAKTLRRWLPEHVIVEEMRLPLGVTEPTAVQQRFIHKNTASGPISAIQNEEYVIDAAFDFTIKSDCPITADEWAAIWTTAQNQGIGASRSQGYGTFTVTRWDQTG